MYAHLRASNKSTCTWACPACWPPTWAATGLQGLQPRDPLGRAAVLIAASWWAIQWSKSTCKSAHAFQPPAAGSTPAVLHVAPHSTRHFFCLNPSPHPPSPLWIPTWPPPSLPGAFHLLAPIRRHQPHPSTPRRTPASATGSAMEATATLKVRWQGREGCMRACAAALRASGASTPPCLTQQQPPTDASGADCSQCTSA